MTSPIDPWLTGPDGNLDPFAGVVDFGMNSKDALDPDLALDDYPVLSPDVVIAEGGVVRPDPEPIPEPVVQPDPEPEGPETFEIGDGWTVTREKTRKGWQATLDPGNGSNPEVFYGKTKDELLLNVLTGKANATKKIREQALKIKLGAAPKSVPVQQPTQVPMWTANADEVFEIKTKLESNPDLAFSEWFQKKTGMSLEQLTRLAQQGARANANLETEAVSRQFLGRNPDYYSDQDGKNFERIVKWLAKFKLGKIITDADANDVMYELSSSGNWTVDNLEEAFSDLSSDGLMLQVPRPRQAPASQEPPPPVVVQPEPVSAPRPDERIVRTETRPRAAYGIRTSDVTPVPEPVTPKAPSAEDLDSMTDEQISALLGGVRRARSQSRRSN